MKRLSLKKTTLRVLTPEMAARVHGGATNTGDDTWVTIFCTVGQFCQEPKTPSVNNSPEC